MPGEIQFQKMADGVYLAGIHGPGSDDNTKTGLWILESGGECAVMEMPAPNPEGPSPAETARRIVDEKGWRCRYLLLSHPHIDHDATMGEFRRLFPEAEFPVHYSTPMFLRITEKFWSEGKRGGNDGEFNKYWEMLKSPGRNWYFHHFTSLLTDDVTALTIGGERIYAIYAPKHSLGDMHYVYRGCWFPGDWWLYEGDPSDDRIASSKAVKSLELLKTFAIARDYGIHTVFPAHANNIIRNADFFDIIERTRRHHADLDAERKSKGEIDWSEFDIRSLYYWVFQYRDAAAKRQPRSKDTKRGKK